MVYTDIPNIFYIVFSKESDHATIYDNTSTRRSEDDLVHNRLRR
jgi:hypothetical protein